MTPIGQDRWPLFRRSLAMAAVGALAWNARPIPAAEPVPTTTVITTPAITTADEAAEEVVALADASPGAVVEPSARTPSAPADAIGLRIRFGMKDAEGTDWSGTVNLSQGHVTEMRGWHWAAGDHADGTKGWTVHTRGQPAQSEAERKQVANGKKLPVSDNGVVLRLEGATDATEIEIATGPGKSKFKLADIPFGKNLLALDGNLEIERTPVVTPLAATWADEDYPAAAVAKDGTIYVAWLAFTRGQDFQSHRERLGTDTVKPQTTVLSTGEVRIIHDVKDLDYLAEPTGGERLWVRACRNGKWEEPVAVAEGKNEYFRPSLTIDGSGKLWLLYSEHLEADAHLDYGNWDLMALPISADLKPGVAINISHAPGADILPAATTDSKGTVWVTWMGARETAFHVFVAHQEGDKFSEPARVSEFKANEWDPSIAADKNGNVTVAWDTYEKGDYDVYLRTRAADGKLGDVTAVAATNNFEVRPSLAYDHDGQLWVAWEQSGELWGKDFGALKKLGIPLYQSGRSIGVKVRKVDGSWAKPVGDFANAIPSRNGVRRPNAPACRWPPASPSWRRMTPATSSWPSAAARRPATGGPASARSGSSTSPTTTAITGARPNGCRARTTSWTTAPPWPPPPTMTC